MALARAGGPLTCPRWSRGQMSCGRNSCLLLTGFSGARCRGPGGAGSFPSSGWGGDRASPSPNWGGAGLSSLDHCAGSSPSSAAEVAAPAAGRAWAPACQAPSSPFISAVPRPHWVLATEGPLRRQPVPPLCVPRAFGPSSPFTKVPREPCLVPALRAKRWRWLALGAGPSPTPGGRIPCDDPSEGQEGWHGDFVTCSSAQRPACGQSQGESGDLWRGGKMRPPFVPHPKSSLGAIKML